ncbi:disulfide oxidoreductase [Paenibacillus daejeonensis]|uniref:disulfide oxidoreductase n=1 Tax=Paenibacillus daejeonensis TaxID=135193 RepID=UPI00036225D3|nr:disulfide oxidoreductase [Paenibacillus daejeonensis]
MRIVKDYYLYAAWLVAVVATLGSLYFSEIRGFIPCELCWYQRILMYPLSLILGVAAFVDDDKCKKYVLPLAALGAVVSTYHYFKQKLPWLDAIQPCTQGVPCNVQYINWFGFITIPFLAGTAFILITILMILGRKSAR